MRRFVVLVAVAVVFAGLALAKEKARFTPAPEEQHGLVTFQATRFDVSPPLRDILTSRGPRDQHKRVIDEFEPPEGGNILPDDWQGVRGISVTEPVVQTWTSGPEATQAWTAGLNFEGLGYLFHPATSPAVYPVYVLPPDTQGAIGSNYYLQWVNTDFALFNKTTGVIYDRGGSTTDDWWPGDALWSGFGGECEYTNDGDPITVFDQLAQRWVMTQLAGIRVGDPYQCFAVSVTDDPLGSWYRYAFAWPNGNLNDYPKLAVWPDAYYLTVDEFTPDGSGFYGASATAFERDAMLSGCWPQAITTGPLQYPNPNPTVFYDHLLPATADGDPPPYGSPNYLMAATPNTGNNALLIWKFHVDWTTPANSTFGTDGVNPNSSVAITAWTEEASIGQRGTTQILDPISGIVLHRLAYRNFGNYESLVTNMTVSSSSRGAPRFFEVRSPGGTPTLFQDGTYSPAETYAYERWMGSTAMDGAGNMALGYSISRAGTATTGLYPSIRYNTRLVTDTAGTLTGGETTVQAGSNYQTGTNRWGDYSSMTVDPVDDMTFWYTQEYIANAQPSNQWNWQTRVTSFKFTCSTSAPAAPTNLTATATAASQITLSWTASVGATRYRVLRSSTSGGPYGPAGVATGASYVDQFVKPGETYYYAVKAYKDNNCWSAASSEVPGTAYGDCTTKPHFDGLDRVLPQGGTCSLRLEWSAGASNCGGDVVYNVYRSTTSGFTPGASTLIANCVTDTFYVDSSSLTPGTKYYYAVRAEDSTTGHGGLCNGGNEDANTYQYWNVPPDGNNAYALNEQFDSVTPGQWPAGWAHGSFGLGVDDWLGAQACGSPPTGTQALRFGGSAGCSAVYDVNTDSLALASVDIPSGIDNLRLSFQHKRSFRAHDGGNLWVSFADKYGIGAFPFLFWVDLETAVTPTTYLLSGQGYNGTAANGQAVFAGSSLGWDTTVVDLSSFCDSLSAEGWPANCAESTLYLGFVGYSGLYDRTDYSSNGAPDQDFESAYDTYDCRGADDFTVTDAAGWTVQKIGIDGSYSAGGPAASLDIWILSNNAGVPGPNASPVCSYLGVTSANYTDNGGSFVITLPSACFLAQGTYWLAFQVNMNVLSGGQHYWSVRNDAPMSGNESVWQENGGFLTPAACRCTTPAVPCDRWGRTGTVCHVGGGSATTPLDFVFGVYGYVGSTVPTTTGWLVDNAQVYWNTVSNCNAGNDPQPLKFFTATSTSGQNKLEWLNPSGGTYGSTMIRYRTDTYPTSPTNGTLLVNQTGTAGAYDTTTHSSLTNTTTYYYAAWVNNGSGDYAGPLLVSGRPQDTTGAVKWVYNTGATALSPPGLGSVYAVSNDRVLHSMVSGTSGGTWPSPPTPTWKPMAMNRPAQGRPPVVTFTQAPYPGGSSSNGKAVFLGSQDGYVYAVNANTGAVIWQVQPGGAGTMVQSAPAGIFSQFMAGRPDLILVGTRTAGVNNTFYGLNLTNGSTAWNFTGSTVGYIGIMSGKPWVDYTNGKVYFTSRHSSGGTGTLWCVQLVGSPGSICSGSWPVALGDIDSSPAMKGNTIYVGNNAGTVYAVNATTGATVWSYATSDGPVKGHIFTDPANDALYLSTTNTVWSLKDAGAHFTWSRTGISNPSTPLFLIGRSRVMVGSGSQQLYLLNAADGTNASVSGWPLTVGGASVAVGSPSYETSTGLAYVGSESGAVYAVLVP